MPFRKLFIPRKQYMYDYGTTFAPDPARDELANYLAIEQWANDLSQGGTATSLRYATVVVAASNSLHHTIADADFVCAGIHDQTTLAAAFAALPAEGGKVLCMEGDYLFDNSSLPAQGGMVAVPANTTLEGMGAATKFKIPDLFGPLSNTWILQVITNNVAIRNMQFNLGSVSAGAGVGSILAQQDSNILVDGCTFVNGSGSGVAPVAFDATPGVGPSKAIFSNNVCINTFIAANNAGAAGAGTVLSLIVANNVFSGGASNAIQVFHMNDCHIVGNYIENISGTGFGAIYVFDTNDSNIVGNVMRSVPTGVYIDSGSNHLMISDNRIEAAQLQGINAIDLSDSIISANMINGCSAHAANTYDSILLQSSCNNDLVKGNMFRGTASRYAINNVGGAGGANTIVENDAHGGYTTAATNNTGTALFNLDGSANNWNRA